MEIKNIPISCSETSNISFSSDKRVIPYRLNSKMQDEFHVTSSQIHIRSYLELKEQVLSDDEILSKMFSNYSKNLPDSEKTGYYDFLNSIKSNISKIDSEFDKIIPLIIPKTFYRGITADSYSGRTFKILNEAKKGDVIIPDLGYPFVSSSKKLAEGYAEYSDGTADPKNCIVMKIKLPAGTRIARDLKYLRPNEYNVVLKRGISYEVLDKEIKDNKTYITLKYLKADKSN